MRFLSLVGALMLALVASCGMSEPPTDFELQAVEDVVRVAIEAQNERDAEAFLEYWTDKGLSEYDIGSRADLEAGKVEDFGRERIFIQRFSQTQIDGDDAKTTVDIVRGAHQNAAPVSRVTFALAEQEGVWLIDGFDFVGPTPVPRGTELIDIEAREYSYRLEEDEIPRRVAFGFRNSGREPHEITLIKGPDDVTLDRAKEELKDFDGENAPEGYQADHVAFAEAGERINVTFSRPLPAGAYVLACFIPQGGSEEHEHVDADAPTHFELGMVAILGVR